MRKLVLPLVFIIAFALCACGGESSVVKEIPVQSDYIQYDYDALKATSEIIIKVLAQDDLSEKNSIIVQDENDPDAVSDYYAERKVKVLDVYEENEHGSVKQGDTMTVVEDAAMTKNYYYHGEDYKALESGSEYILFLNRDNAEGQYSIISANNGKVCTSKFTEMEELDDRNYEIAVKALIEYESDLMDDEKASLLKKNVQKSGSKKELSKSIQLQYGTLWYDDSGDAIRAVVQ